MAGYRDKTGQGSASGRCQIGQTQIAGRFFLRHRFGGQRPVGTQESSGSDTCAYPGKENQVIGVVEENQGDSDSGQKSAGDQNRLAAYFIRKPNSRIDHDQHGDPHRRNQIGGDHDRIGDTNHILEIVEGKGLESGQGHNEKQARNQEKDKPGIGLDIKMETMGDRSEQEQLGIV